MISGVLRMKIERDKQYSKEEFFWFLYNKLGYSNLCLCYNYMKEGVLGFSKWLPYSYLLRSNIEDKVKTPFLLMRKTFIKRVSHRSILDIEIMLDIDDVYLYDNFGYLRYTFDSIKAKSKWVTQMLDQEHIEYSVYWTGSKSYHISYLDFRLRKLSSYSRRQYKQKIAFKFGADLQKCSDRVMISLEEQPHYKSGLPKKKIKL